MFAAVQQNCSFLINKISFLIPEMSSTTCLLLGPQCPVKILSNLNIEFNLKLSGFLNAISFLHLMITLLKKRKKEKKLHFKEERFIVNFVKEKTARTTIFSECTHHIRSFSTLHGRKKICFVVYNH